MGKPMSLNLLKAGFDVMVFDINQDAVNVLVEAGATAGSVAEMGETCDCIITMLPAAPM